MKLKDLLGTPSEISKFSLKEKVEYRKWLKRNKNKIKQYEMAVRSGNVTWEFMICSDLEKLGVDCDMDRFPTAKNSN